MRKGFTSLLIFVQFITAFQFITPYLSYQLNYDFIVNEWCRSKYEPRFVECNGSCFLKNAQKRAADQQSEEQESNITITNPIPIYFQDLAFETVTPEITYSRYASFSEEVINHSSRPSTPPPKV